MASVSVVQHPGPLFKLSSGRKKILPRKSSREKMLFRRRSGTDGECGSATTGSAPGELVPDPMSPEPVGETAVRGGRMPCEGCGAQAACSAPRSPDGEERGTGCDRSTAAGTPESQTGHGDSNKNSDCLSHHNTGGRKGTELKRSGISVMSSATAANGHTRAHRDWPHRSRDSRSSHNGQQSISSGSSHGDTSGLPLERLTQGRTGVVRLVRSEPHRREAWSIFPQEVDPRVRTEKGEGHRFESRPVTQDWCDACSRQITTQALKCQSK
ncbi:hypothetical protein LDENG_00276890 [Lucifuga dentata]|nr:hypothetical protein LDENG_00276890 [Lucifuga dentata]